MRQTLSNRPALRIGMRRGQIEIGMMHRIVTFTKSSQAYEGALFGERSF